MSQNLVTLFRYNRWATRQLIAFCAQLSDAQLDATLDGVYGSIRATLEHIIRSEEHYTVLLTGGRWQPTPAASTGLAGLAERAAASGAALADVAAQDQTEHVLRGERRGEPYVLPALIPLAQAIHHADDHRSQIATLLSRQGIEPPDLDVWSFHSAGMPD
jgi:uncharacterized damage-inducible protein DinB